MRNLAFVGGQRGLLGALLVGAVLLTGCTGQPQEPPASSPAQRGPVTIPVTPPEPAVDDRTPTTASSQVVCLLGDSPEAVALANRIMVVDPTPRSSPLIAFAIHDDRTDVTCSNGGDDHFESASVIKVATVAALLWQSEVQGFELTEDEGYLAEAAITVSDNDAQQVLWEIVGGAEAMQQFFTAAGMANTIPSFADEDWGLTAITASDQLRLVRHLVDATLLTREHSDYLLDLMRRVDPEQAWGISAGAPEGAEIAIKNGWLDDPVVMENDLPDDQLLPEDWPEVTWTNNSIGHVRAPGASYSMVILTQENRSDELGRAAINQLATALAGAVLG